MIERLGSGKLIALSVLGLALTAQSAPEVPSGDQAQINSQIVQMLSTPKGQIREWSGSGGNRGQVRVGPAVDTVEGETCASWSSCSDPCRNVDYSFVGQDRNGQTVDNNYRLYYCFRQGSWTSARAPQATRRVLAAKPEPPRTVVIREKSAPVVIAPTQPAKLAHSPVRADLVRSLQRRLKSLLYYGGTESGHLDAPTLAALHEFLVDEGLEAGDLRVMGTPDLVFIDSRLRDANERSRSGDCRHQGRFVACGTVR